MAESKGYANRSKQVVALRSIVAAKGDDVHQGYGWLPAIAPSLHPASSLHLTRFLSSVLCARPGAGRPACCMRR